MNSLSRQHVDGHQVDQNPDNGNAEPDRTVEPILESEMAKKINNCGRGAGLVVGVLALNPEDPSSNDADY